jgi:hypothetical protein
VPDDAVHVGSCVFASGFVRCSPSALTLPPESRPAGVAEAEAPLEWGVVPDLVFFLWLIL